MGQTCEARKSRWDQNRSRAIYQAIPEGDGGGEGGETSPTLSGWAQVARLLLMHKLDFIHA